MLTITLTSGVKLKLIDSKLEEWLDSLRNAAIEEGVTFITIEYSPTALRELYLVLNYLGLKDMIYSVRDDSNRTRLAMYANGYILPHLLLNEIMNRDDDYGHKETITLKR